MNNSFATAGLKKKLELKKTVIANLSINDQKFNFIKGGNNLNGDTSVLTATGCTTAPPTTDITETCIQVY